jgi:hypothetical protein
VPTWLARTLWGATALLVAMLAASAYSSLSVLRSVLGGAPGAAPAPELERPAEPPGALSRAAPAAAPRPVVPPAPAPAPTQAPAADPRPLVQPTPVLAGWETAPITSRALSMGRAGLDLERGIIKLRPELSKCFTEQGQLGYAGRPVPGVEHPEFSDPGSPVFQLEVEAVGGRMHISAAPVEVPSGASGATLACLQAGLSDLWVPTEGTSKAPRFKLRYRIDP